MRAHAALVRQRDEGVVVDLSAGAPDVDLAVDADRGAEELDGLIDEVRAEVEQHSAALEGIGRLAPHARPHFGTEALEARLEARDLAEGPLGDQPPERDEVAVPAPVLEDRQPAPGGEQSPRLGRVRRERLVDDDRQPALEAREPELHV